MPVGAPSIGIGGIRVSALPSNLNTSIARSCAHCTRTVVAERFHARPCAHFPIGASVT
jgi:hypothetical protein